jgi:hypothetical protein
MGLVGKIEIENFIVDGYLNINSIKVNKDKTVEIEIRRKQNKDQIHSSFHKIERISLNTDQFNEVWSRFYGLLSEREGFTFLKNDETIELIDNPTIPDDNTGE